LESAATDIKTAEYDARGRQLQVTIGPNCIDKCAERVRYLKFVFWPFAGPPIVETRRSYDPGGKLTLIEKQEESIPKWISRYEFDSHGNWIKKTSLTRDPSLEGYPSFVPREIEYRNITYFGEKG